MQIMRARAGQWTKAIAHNFGIMLLCRPTRPFPKGETARGFQPATALAACEPQGLDGVAMKAAVVKRRRKRSGTQRG